MKRAQKGFGLIEMMISMVIGLVLLLGISAILISMTRTSDLRRRMADVQAAQRVAMTMVGNGVRYAGGFPYSLSDSQATKFPAAGSFGVGQSLAGTGNTLSLRFIASSTTTASQGCSPSLTANAGYTNVLSVADGYLTCVETNTTASAPAETVKLIGGMTGMTVLYGVDSTGSGFVNQYLTADEVTSPANLWDNVKTVKLTLTFTNPLAGEKGQENKPTVSVTQVIPHAIGL